MDEPGEFLSQCLLKDPFSRIPVVLCDERFRLCLAEKCEDLHPAACVLITGVDPELVEFIGRGLGPVQPYAASLGLSEFCAVAFFNELRGEGVGLSPALAADELGAAGDVSPLV